MDSADFSEEEIEEQLALLGVTNIPRESVREFKQGLDEMIQSGELNTIPSATQRNPSTSQHRPPAYTKEKVTQCNLADFDGFFLRGANDDRRVLSSCQTRDYGRQQGPSDPYTNHSVALKPRMPRSAPSRLQADPEDTPDPQLSDSCTPSPDTQGRCFMKRKVIRKHEGQSLICNESVYIEDSVPSLSPHRSHTSAGERTTVYKMYNAQLDDDSSSFWSDGEKQDDEEKVERVTEEDSGPVDEAGHSPKTSEEDRPELLHHRESPEDDGCSRSASPAPSLMTSGYGTYRPEEQEGDDHTATERGDLFEARDDDRSLCGFDVESVHEPEENVEFGGDEGLHDVNLEDGVTDAASEERHVPAAPSEEHVESEDPDEAPSNKDLKFIDSTADFSWMLDEGWEGNLRRKKDAMSCLEERLADVHVSTLAQRDFETGSEDLTSQCDTYSSGGDRISQSAFESYLQGMTQTAGDVKPKPKAFIRPMLNQQNAKKTDAVARYFQYKQLWEMFKIPGDERRALRWELREQLAYQPPPKPRRVYVPNSYIVPTEKKRLALRWEIRNDLANGLLPYKFNY